MFEHWSEGWNPRSFDAGSNKHLRIRPRGSEEIDGNLELIRAALARAARLLMAGNAVSCIKKRSIAERFLGKGSEDLSLSIFPLIRQQRSSGARLGGEFHQDAGALTSFTADF